MVRGSGHRRKGQIVTRTCLFSSFFLGLNNISVAAILNCEWDWGK